MRIKFKQGAFREIRTLPAVQDEVEKRADRIASASGPGYVVQSGVTGGRGRARSAVITGDFDAILDNARHQTLLRNLDAGKG